MTRYILLLLLLITYIDYISCLPIVSTSITAFDSPTQGMILGFSESTNIMSIIGGTFGLNQANPYVITVNLVTDSVLYDENDTPNNVNASSANKELQITLEQPNVENPFDDLRDVTNRFSCNRQCATQIGSMLYILNPITTTDNRESQTMVIFDVDTRTYIDQTVYQKDIPNGIQFVGDDDTGCVVNDGIKIFILIPRLSDIPFGEQDPLCPDGGNEVCPIAELYAYDPNTDTWTTREELSSPNISVRLGAGCAMGIDNQDIYIFGGINRIDATRTPSEGVYETEKYNIATNTWTVLGIEANLDVMRWKMFSFVSPTEEEIYLYGGFTLDENNDEQDTKIFSVFSISLQRILLLEDLTPEWENGHYLGLSNTLNVQNLCPFEVGISVGSYDFNTQQNIVDFQLLRFGDLVNYSDNSIIIQSDTDTQSTIFDAYGAHIFDFTIITTQGAPFIPDTNEENYDFLVTDWEGIERDINGMNQRFTRRGNGRAAIVTIESITQGDVGLFNRCNACSNVIQVINIQIRIRRQGRRNYLCGQTRINRLRRWPFRDSDPDNDGVLEYDLAGVRLEVINPSDNQDSEISDFYSLTHDCTVN